jgi:hypothetical protein
MLFFCLVPVCLSPLLATATIMDIISSAYYISSNSTPPPPNKWIPSIWRPLQFWVNKTNNQSIIDLSITEKR